MLCTNFTSIKREREGEREEGSSNEPWTFQCLQVRTGGGSSKDQERAAGEARGNQESTGSGRPSGEAWSTGPNAAHGSGNMRTENDHWV